MKNNNSIQKLERKITVQRRTRRNQRTCAQTSTEQDMRNKAKKDNGHVSPDGSPRAILPDPVTPKIHNALARKKADIPGADQFSAIPAALPPFDISVLHWSPVARLRDSVLPSLRDIRREFSVCVALRPRQYNVAGFAALLVSGPDALVRLASSALLALPDARLRYVSGPDERDGTFHAACMAPRAHAALVIGRGGETRQLLEQRSGAKVVLKRPRDFATPQCELRIHGRIGQIRKAAIGIAAIVSATRRRELDLVLPCTTRTDERLETRSFSVCREQAARLVGRNGASAQFVRRACGVEMWVEGNGLRTSTKTVFVRGGEHCVEKAFTFMDKIAAVKRNKIRSSLQ